MNFRPSIYALLALIVLLGMLAAFRKSRTVTSAEEQAVIVKLKLASSPMGNDEERQRIGVLEERIADAIKRSAAGEFDGDEYGDGYCTIYTYGPSAETLYAAIRPALEGFHASSGSYVLKRFGKPGSKQDRVSLDSK